MSVFLITLYFLPRLNTRREIRIKTNLAAAQLAVDIIWWFKKKKKNKTHLFFLPSPQIIKIFCVFCDSSCWFNLLL